MNITAKSFIMAMSQHAFVVGEIGYEYHHDIYKPLDCEGAIIPHAIYQDRDAAEKEATRLNIEALRREEIHSYAYCIEDLFTDSSFWRGAHVGGDLSRVVDILSPYGVESWSHPREIGEAFRRATDEELECISSLLGLRFFTVAHVKIAD